MAITVVHQTSGYAQHLGSLKRQIPYALSRSINETLYSGRIEQQKQVDKYFDGGATPFTKRGFRYTKATKNRLIGTLYIDATRAGYMRLMIQGGIDTPEKRALVQPVLKNTRVNKYGNLTRGRVRTLLSSPDVFSGVPKGTNRPAGIYRRTRNGRGLRMMIAYESTRSVNAKYPAYTIAAKHSKSVLPKRFNTNLANAIRTAR